MNIYKVLEALARNRPIFHNEADFQHALAWEIRERNDCTIRLEKRVDIANDRRTYVDIFVEQDGQRVAIELKYKMRALEYVWEGETFSLLNQGAQDNGRYDILKDLQRLEQMVKRGIVDQGYLIYLTNDASYYKDTGMDKPTADREFRIHQGRTITGTLAWGENTGAGTMKGREESLTIEGTYTMNWTTYSHLNDTPAGTIQSLLISVSPESLLRDAAAVTPGHPLSKQLGSIPAISSIVRSLSVIPVSQLDLRDRLRAALQQMGYKVEVNRDIGTMKIDIWATDGDGENAIAIEVRYKTALLNTIYKGTTIKLKDQLARDIARYDYMKDVEKIEKLVASRPGTRGYVVLITNDCNYWQPPKRDRSVDEDFRIHHGRQLHGQLVWRNASDGTTWNREELIDITGTYDLKWQPYLTLGSGKNEIFQMLILEVTYPEN
ncbi:hypothetical protein [Paenibacillus xylaniclasticus]|uniref:hypothetical protein n=1 Tax=Paenibacillus xylaniclasticus TaxID=588083 RepID=UPI000FDAB2AF|nr:MULTISPECIES: hypothetical protein [Paenibacillus]GFN33969.1 hypothetical protein PCURB6_42290 [Paenibacillus curdlanolyticus]